MLWFATPASEWDAVRLWGASARRLEVRGILTSAFLQPQPAKFGLLALLRKSEHASYAFAPIQGRRRMTLTYPMINRDRRILQLVTGSEKVDMVARLRKGRSVDSGGTRSPG